jgi:hypothetical protein
MLKLLSSAADELIILFFLIYFLSSFSSSSDDNEEDSESSESSYDWLSDWDNIITCFLDFYYCSITEAIIDFPFLYRCIR